MGQLRLVAVHGGELVGYVDLAGSEVGWRELGYVVERWRLGLGSAGARLGLVCGFGVLGLREISG
ncbi:hypothetical protein [Kribbella ginsengisoli]|uniref:hypothetical protein n=1 Tax=Kribbella ginsengisoli TaxID=363865 RepID=UPI0031E1C2DA